MDLSQLKQYYDSQQRTMLKLITEIKPQLNDLSNVNGLLVNDWLYRFADIQQAIPQNIAQQMQLIIQSLKVIAMTMHFERYEQSIAKLSESDKKILRSLEIRGVICMVDCYQLVKCTSEIVDAAVKK